MTALIIRKAQPEEFSSVRAFYHEVIEKMENTPYHPAWKKGIYPSDEYLHTLLHNGHLYLGCADGFTVAAMAVNHDCNESYANVPWSVNALPDDVAVIHLLCVHPRFARKGYARQLVRYAVSLAQTTCSKCLRLDVLAGNLPALRLYESEGFHRVTTLPMFYEDTGWTDFILYEYPL